MQKVVNNFCLVYAKEAVIDQIYPIALLFPGYYTVVVADSVPEPSPIFDYDDVKQLGYMRVYGYLMKALRLIQCTGLNDSRVVKLLAPGTVLSSH